MISQIRGTLLEKTTHSMILDVNGLGYEIEVPLSTAFNLPDAGGQVHLFTHFVVREDAQLLFGFLKRADRDMFRTLIKVNGVGPKLGVAILSGLDSQGLARCVQNDDVSSLVKLPGIGKKTAERLLIELRDKIQQVAGVDETPEAAHGGQGGEPLDAQSEAETALIALGYKPQDAAKMIKRVNAPGMSLEDLLKNALKSMN